MEKEGIRSGINENCVSERSSGAGAGTGTGTGTGGSERSSGTGGSERSSGTGGSERSSGTRAGTGGSGTGGGGENKIRWFRSFATVLFLIYIGIMIFVIGVAFTHRSGRTSLDMGLVQKMRYEANLEKYGKKVDP